MSGVLVLVGPKGAGKTTLGRVLGRGPGSCFLEVERIAREVLAAHGGTIDEAYARRVFEAVVVRVAELAREHDTIVLETTGASTETPAFLAALRARHRVKLARIVARAETCAERITARDPTHQVTVPADLIREMHARTESLQLPWDLVVENDPPLAEAEIVRVFAPLLA